MQSMIKCPCSLCSYTCQSELVCPKERCWTGKIWKWLGQMAASHKRLKRGLCTGFCAAVTQRVS